MLTEEAIVKNFYTNKEMMNILINGRISVVTDLGEIILSNPKINCENNSYTYENNFARIEVSVYSKDGDTVYRRVSVLCKADITLYKINFMLEFDEEPDTFIDYKTFINAPGAVFIRYRDFGFYTGVENPFFYSCADGNKLCISYEPSLILKKDDIYESEPQFFGYYKSCGEYIKEKAPVSIGAIEAGHRRSRFFNPSGEIPLDIAEADAMRKYVAEYYNVIEREFNNILYFFFYPKKKLPETEAEINDYISVVDRFGKMDGDMIAFNPHTETTIPTAEKPYWELAPKNSPAERILNYAKGKGMKVGYYMGCAFNGSGGNAALLPFMPDEKKWKKIDRFGNESTENCLGCDEYLNWWFDVQKNTIEKYDLGYWSWDPGPGNGNDCYASNHGHIPGKGEYKGWRNSQILLKNLKQAFPKLFLMSFYGRKEYGIWGFRYFSQHEVYWEQTILYGATIHNDMHDDRNVAHGIRLQNQWSMNFRFMPANIGHGLVSRMGESYYDPELDRAYDYKSYKHSLLSSIAACGSVTHCNIPDCLENIEGFAEFHNKWSQWARENYRYCEFTRPVSNGVSNYEIDGFTRIHKDKGQIFLFNSSPKVVNKKLMLDKYTGLDTEKEFYLNILYAEGYEEECCGLQYQRAFHMGDALDITLPPYGAVVLELTYIQGKSIDSIPRCICTADKFVDGDGNTFEYPEHDAYKEITLCTHAEFKHELRECLEKQNNVNKEFIIKKIPKWRNEKIPFTFAGAFPERLGVYIPFDSAVLPDEVSLFINGNEVCVEIFRLDNMPVYHYAFIEDYVIWDENNTIRLEIKGLAENSFMGLYFDYPEKCDGMKADEIIFEESCCLPDIYYNPKLKIDSFEITPDAIADIGEDLTVTVRTGVCAKEIEAVYFLHPTKPQVFELAYDEGEDVWRGCYPTGDREKNIFCNPCGVAWIKAKDGGIGSKEKCEVSVRYVKSKI